jgi:hypothetical protein
MVPVVSGDFVWTYQSASSSGDTVVYDRRTHAEVTRFLGSRGDLNSPFGAPGALADRAFLLDHGRIYDYPGFDVFPVGTSPCGDPIDPGSGLKVSDALGVLRASIGLFACELCICDVDGSGSVLATDALLVLNASVGLPITRRCPACARARSG